MFADATWSDGSPSNASESHPTRRMSTRHRGQITLGLPVTGTGTSGSSRGRGRRCGPRGRADAPVAAIAVASASALIRARSAGARRPLCVLDVAVCARVRPSSEQSPPLSSSRETPGDVVPVRAGPRAQGPQLRDVLHLQPVLLPRSAAGGLPRRRSPVPGGAGVTNPRRCPDGGESTQQNFGSGLGADIASAFESARVLDRVARDAQIEQDIARISQLSWLLAALHSSALRSEQE